MQNGSRPNGAVAATALAAGIGSLAFGLAVVASEARPSVAAKLNWYNPTGPLSGKTSAGVIIWLIAWAVFSALWKGSTIRLKAVFTWSLLLIAVGLVLTFPPVFDAIAGK